MEALSACFLPLLVVLRRFRIRASSSVVRFTDGAVSSKMAARAALEADAAHGLGDEGVLLHFFAAVARAAASWVPK